MGRAASYHAEGRGPVVALVLLVVVLVGLVVVMGATGDHGAPEVAAGGTAPAAPSGAAAGAPKPGPPQLVAVAARPVGAALWWRAPGPTETALTSYVVLTSPPCPACTGLTVTGSPPAGGTTVSGLAVGVPYRFSVAAVDAAGVGAPSATSQAVVPTAPAPAPAPAVIAGAAPAPPVVAGSAPVPPVAVAVTATDGQAVVTWATGSGGGAPAQFTVRAGSPSGALAETVPGSARQATIDGLTDGTPYQVTVTARNGAGAATTAVTSPVVPTHILGLANTVSLGGLTATNTGGSCPGSAMSSCYSIQQNFFAVDGSGSAYWVQNVLEVEPDPTRPGDVRLAGGFEVWNYRQIGSPLACSTGVDPAADACNPLVTWHAVPGDTTVELTSAIQHGSLSLADSLGDAWSCPGVTGAPCGAVPTRQFEFVFNPTENGHNGDVALARPCATDRAVGCPAFYTPELVLVGANDSASAHFLAGAGSVTASVLLGTGTVLPQSECLTNPITDSTGESGTGLLWSVTAPGDASFGRAPGGSRWDPDGLKFLPNADGLLQEPAPYRGACASAIGG